MSTDLVLKEELKGIEPSKAQQIEATFTPMIAMLKEFEGLYDEVIALDIEAEETAKKAKRLRLDIGKIRVEAEKNRKKQKEEYLRAGKAIDGVSNILKFAIVEKENKLKEIETFKERKEAERLEALQLKRCEELLKYEVDGEFMNLAGMDDLIWANFLSGTKAGYDNKIAAELKAEEDRKADEERARLAQIEKEKEAKRIRVENERLKKEAKAREEAARKERAEREAKEEKARLAREEENRKQQEIIRAERLKAEAAEKKALEEKRAREEADRKIKADLAKKNAEEETARKQKLAAPDAEKLRGLSVILSETFFTTTEAKQAQEKAISTLRVCADRITRGK